MKMSVNKSKFITLNGKIIPLVHKKLTYRPVNNITSKPTTISKNISSNVLSDKKIDSDIVIQNTMKKVSSKNRRKSETFSTQVLLNDCPRQKRGQRMDDMNTTKTRKILTKRKKKISIELNANESLNICTDEKITINTNLNQNTADIDNIVNNNYKDFFPKTNSDYMEVSCLKYDENGYMPIHISIINNDVYMLNFYIQELIDYQLVIDQPTKNMGYSPLQLAIIYGCTDDIFQLLLRRSVNIFSQDLENNNILHHCISEDVHYLHQLMEHISANAIILLEEWLIVNKNIRGNDNLSLNSDISRNESLNHLLRYTFSMCNSDGYTPIMLGVNQMKFDHLNCLLTNLPFTTSQYIVNILNPTNGKTALYLLIESGLDEDPVLFNSLISLLIKNGADPRIKNYANYNIYNIIAMYKCKNKFNEDVLNSLFN